MQVDRNWSRDAAERIGWTFVQASIAAVGSEALAVGIADGDVSVLRGALVDVLRADDPVTYPAGRRGD